MLVVDVVCARDVTSVLHNHHDETTRLFAVQKFPAWSGKNEEGLYLECDIRILCGKKVLRVDVQVQGVLVLVQIKW